MGERFSFTKLSLADKCFAAYRVRYEVPFADRLPSPFNRLRESGTAVHACIDAYKKHLQATEQQTDMSIVSLIVEEVFTNNPEIRSTEIYDDVFWTFRSFAKQYVHNAEKYIGGEFLLERALPESDDTIEAYPDHIETMQDDKGPIIISDDYKTGYAQTVTESHTFQGEIAAWLLMEWFPGQRVGYRVNFPRQEKLGEIVEFLPIAAPRLEGRMRSIIARIRRARENQAFPATPGSACKYCEIAVQCRERNVAVEAGIQVDDDATAKKAAFDYMVLDAARDQRIEQLKAWAKVAGPVPVNETEALGFVTKQGGAKIGNLERMVTKLGVDEAIAQRYFKDAESIEETDDNARLILALGVRVATELKLLSINGNITKAKAIQNDSRLAGLWVPGDSRTEFAVFVPQKDPVKQ